ncbi:Uncharacterized protein, similar to the N-terminal domain of Lon protease [Pseudoalteromonas luteoviolacea B = ATCC 29581]|nr:Uncharacterized protein, similar to the N-terminal domain of Lon protease [Pseudoalteromonas luteoviolacea B = ATCC 29581]
MIRALFPLPVFLLPGGATRLRIFEPRYVRMVKEALKQNQGFVLCVYQQDRKDNVPTIGTYVKIVDFDQDTTGQLLIDVQAECLVEIGEVWVEQDKLRQGRVAEITTPPWDGISEVCDSEWRQLSKALENVLLANPELSSLYSNKELSNPYWVACRWLEILPVSVKQKENVLQLRDFEQIKEFLHTLIKTS